MIRLIKLIYLALLVPIMANAGDTETDIQQQVSDYVLSQIQAEPSDKVEAIANTVDQRLNLAACQQSLLLNIKGSGEIRRNTTVDVTCPDTLGWHLFVPVKIRIQKPVVAAATPIAKGTVLSADNLTVTYIDSFLLNGNMTTDMAILIGARSKRELKTNQPIRQDQICVVCRDDTVEIIAEKGGMQIKTSGRALQDGSLHDMIRVQNIRSQRIISAVVSAVGQVKVEM
ncbi:MAG: flagellar basal body P-ring formation chaperone FlgA [Tolumonas sp.]|nr:flagellar basal body P-ring formation chaperone FlgA [Tolumonas sp.]